MIINENGKIYYLTRQHYGTMIEVSVENFKVRFYPNKIRDVEVPETEEDRKVFMVINAICELMKLINVAKITAIIYGKEIVFDEKDSKAEMFAKIFNALVSSIVSANCASEIVHEVETILKKALEKGEIDVY